LFAYAMNKSLRRVNNECRLPTVEEILERHQVPYEWDIQEWKCFNVSNPTLVDISPCERLDFVVVDFPKTINNK